MIELTKVNKENWSEQSPEIRWVERDDNGVVIDSNKKEPKIGYTLVLNPYDNQYQTKPITEIITSTDKIIHFKTEDEEYKLYLAKHFKDIYEKLKD
jgi:hypothetical protein